MVTSPAIQLDPSTLDMAGVSVATSTATGTNPRWGSVYDPVTVAAAAPVWAHCMFDGSTLMLCARRWYAATPLSAIAGGYSAFSEDTKPSWWLVKTPGSRVSVPGQPINIPMTTVATSVVLVAGASRPPNLLFLLSSATVNSIATAVLQRFHVNANGAVSLANEEVLPVPANGVIFNKGLQFNGDNVVVYGTDSAHKVYKATKPWAQVGINKHNDVVILKTNNPTGPPLGWQFFTGTGYSADPTELAPLIVSGGAQLLSYGPMSFGWVRNQVVMSTVDLAGSTYTGHLWTSRSGMPFSTSVLSVPLGSSSAGSYLGGGIQLCGQLAPNPATSAMTAAGVISGIPYVTGIKNSVSGGHALTTQWSICPVRA